MVKIFIMWEDGVLSCTIRIPNNFFELWFSKVLKIYQSIIK